jgi:rhamnogalacturonyl hydrolase YesR
MSHNYLEICRQVLEAAKQRDYTGYSKFDALNSPLLHTLSCNNKWLRLIWTQAVKECPWHVRPLLGVKTSRNPKGIALFARAYLHLFTHTGQADHLNEAIGLIDWLLAHPSPDQSHLSWGYNYIWQSPIFLQDAFEPNAVVTVFVGEALMHAYRVTHNEKYLAAAQSAGQFLLEDLPVLHEEEDERASAYVLRPVGAIVLNNQVLIGAFLIKLWTQTREQAIFDTVIKMYNYTVNRRTPYAAWFYTYPKGKSPIRHDNYHTGGILDALLEFYEATQDDRYMPVYWDGLSYYAAHLFEDDGAPRWMNDRRYPYDIHGAAQGIISFTKASRHKLEFEEQAKKIAAWTIANLYQPRTSAFVYRRSRFLTWNYSLMRWCNGWMTRALGALMTASKSDVRQETYL